MNKLNAVSLFSGCGGFDYGATKAGLNIIWANDKDKHTYDAYKSILPDVPMVIEDIRKINEFPQADVLIGCYPCTGFSIAARRKWKDGKERDLMQVEGNFLYQEYLRALKQIKPKYFFVENVLGMESAMDGWFFNQQIEGFKELGYTPSAKLLRAIDYGLAQDRKRVFIVGVRNDIAENFVYEFPKPLFGPNLKPYRNMKEVIYDMPLWPKGEVYEGPYHGHYLTRNRKRDWEQPSYTIVAHAAHIPLHPAGEPMMKLEKDKWSLIGDVNRRLSWRECARLQGLPDNISPTGSLKDKYRVIGNAVPPLFAEIIIKPIMDYEKQKTNERNIK
ncbi:Modification methylase BspRI [compost metagenome]